MKRNAVFIIISLVLVFAAVIPYYMSMGTGIRYFFVQGSDMVNAKGYPTEAIIIEEQKIAEENRILQERLKKEMRAIWVAYLSLSKVDKAKIDEIVKNCVEMKINTVFFHVRPFGDALYSSNFFPWSHLITGEQGRAPENGFDPLKYMTDKCKENGIKVHAWINPLRIRNSASGFKLSSNNPAYGFINDENVDNDRYVIEYDGGMYYNPAYKNVRNLIINGISEIVRNYDVDGIHIDDYFYPAENDSFDDGAEYEEYKKSGGALTLNEWRCSNINELISGIYKAVKANDADAVFGISPAGNIENCLKMGADVKTWCTNKEYVDYICPQLYWSFEHKTMPFDKACSQWESLVTNKDIKLYLGLALYKAGSQLDEGTWKTSNDIIKRQIEFLRKKENIHGFALYSYQSLFSAECKAEIENYKTL